MLRKTSSAGSRSFGKDRKSSRDGDRDSRDKSRYGDAVGPRKRSHFLEGVKDINPDDYEFLQKFLTEHGKIIPSRLTGATATQQRKIKRAIRRGRVMGMLT